MRWTRCKVKGDQHRPMPMRKGLCAVVLAGLGVGGFAGTALAAGSPYGGAPVLPVGGVPGGFRSILTAITVSDHGRVIAGHFDGVFGRVVIPSGAARFGEQVIVTRARTGSITTTMLHGVPPPVERDHTIFALGVLFQRDQRPFKDARFVNIDLAGRQFARSDYVVVYSPSAHGFVPAPKGHARVVNGHVVVRVETGTELAVLAP